MHSWVLAISINKTNANAIIILEEIQDKMEEDFFTKDIPHN